MGPPGFEPGTECGFVSDSKGDTAERRCSDAAPDPAPRCRRCAAMEAELAELRRSHRATMAAAVLLLALAVAMLAGL